MAQMKVRKDTPHFEWWVYIWHTFS
jgi:hypothetical protein